MTKTTIQADAPIQECINDVLSVPREKFLNIASKLDSLAFDDDPYEYHDNEGVESISDIADNLLNPTYRKAIIKALQDKQEYYAEDEFDDANIAERAKDILDNLAEIFGSDEQEDLKYSQTHCVYMMQYGIIKTEVIP